MFLSLRNKSETLDTEKVDFTPLYSNVEKIYNLFEEKKGEKGMSHEAIVPVHLQFYKSVIFEHEFLQVIIEDILLDDEKLYVELAIKVKENIPYFKKGFFDNTEGYYRFESYEGHLNVVEIQKIIKERLELINKAMDFNNKKEYHISYGDGKYISSIHRRLDVDNDFVLGNKEKREYTYGQKLKNMFRYLVAHFQLEGSSDIGSFQRNMLWEGVLVRVGNYEDNSVETNNNLSFRDSTKPQVKSEFASFVIKLRDKDFLLRNLNKEQGIYLSFNAMEEEEAQRVFDYVMEAVEEINKLMEEKSKVSKIIRPTKLALIGALNYNTVISSEKLKFAIGQYEELEKKGEAVYAPFALMMLKDISMDLYHKDEMSFNVRDLLVAIADENWDVIVRYYRNKLKRIKPNEERYHFTVAGLISTFKLLSYEKWENAFLADSEFPAQLYDYQLLEFADIIEQNDSRFDREKFVVKMYKKMLFYDMKNKKSFIYMTPNRGPEEENIGSFFARRYTKIRDFKFSRETQDIQEQLILNLLVVLYEKDIEKTKKPLELVLGEQGLETYIGIQRFVDGHGDIAYGHAYSTVIKKYSEGEMNDIEFSDYEQIGRQNMNVFFHNLLVPYALHRMHHIWDSDNLELALELLESGKLESFVTNFLHIKDAGFLKWAHSYEKLNACKEILAYWRVLQNQGEIKDYSIGKLDLIVNSSIDNKRLFEGKTIKVPETAQECLKLITGTKGHLDEELLLECIDKFRDFSTPEGERLAAHPSIKIRRRLAAYHRISKKEVEILFKNKQIEDAVVSAFTRNYENNRISLPDSMRKKLAAHPSVKLRAWMAGYKGIDREEISIIFDKQDLEEEVVDAFISAGNGNLSGVREKLSAHPSVKLRAWIAGYSSVGAKEIKIIFSNKELEDKVINAFIRNGKEGISGVRKMLSAHPSVRLREWIASNKHVGSKELLVILEKKDLEDIVIDAILNNSNISLDKDLRVKMAKHLSVKLRAHVAGSSSLDEQEAGILFANKNVEDEVINKFIRRHSHVPTSLGKKLAAHPSLKIRKWMAGHKELSEEEALVLFGNNDIEKELVDLFMETHGHHYTSKIKMKMLGHSKEYVRRYVS